MQICSYLLLYRYPRGEQWQQKIFLARHLGARWQYHMHSFIYLFTKDLKKEVTVCCMWRSVQACHLQLFVYTRAPSATALSHIYHWSATETSLMESVFLRAVCYRRGPCWQGGCAEGWGDLQLRWSHRDIKQFVHHLHRCSSVPLDLLQNKRIKCFSL